MPTAQSTVHTYIIQSATQFGQTVTITGIVDGVAFSVQIPAATLIAVPALQLQAFLASAILPVVQQPYSQITLGTFTL